MRRALYTLAFAAGAAILLSGCGSNDKTPTAPPPPPPPPPAAPKSVRVTPSADTVTKDSSVVLTAAGLDSAGVVMPGITTFTWSSSDTAVATVTNGTVTGKSAGTATITAKYGTDTLAALSGTATITVVNGASPIQHVVVITMLQKDYSQVFPATGTSPMPFVDSLSKAGARATQYFGNAAPSIGNFFMLAAGDTVTNNDNDTTVFTGDNIFRRLITAGKSWKVYADSLPSVGYVGPDKGRYVRHHNVATLISDSRDTAQRRNIVPLTQLATDLAARALPSFSMIVPNDCYNSTGSCTSAQADAFVRAAVAPILADSALKANTLVIVTFDRSATSTAHGGGRVPFVLAGAKVKAGASDSTTVFQHQSALRLMLSALGITTAPGAAATAADLSTLLNLQ